MSPRGRVRIDGSTCRASWCALNACTRDEPLELVDLGVGDRVTSGCDAGVVHEDVDVAEVVYRGVDHARRGLVVLDCGRVRTCRSAECLDGRDGLLRGVGVAPVVHRDRRTLRGEQRARCRRRCPARLR